MIFEDKLVLNKSVSGETLQRKKSLESTLTQLLKPLGLTFRKLRENTYVINAVRTNESEAAGEGAGSAPFRSEIETQPVHPLSPERMAPVNPTRIGQPTEQTVSGKISDETGAALAGVSVVVKGTTRGTTSDGEGRYRLAVSDESAVLVFSFVGYVPQEITVGNRTVIDVSLKSDNKSLDEVVVIGYGSVKKRDLTGSVASIGAAEIKAQPVSGLNQALQGRVAGVQVTQSSNSAGGGVQVRVRGGNSISASNEPLYVIDGFPVTNPAPAQGASSGNANSNAFPNVLATINPNDIESIEVLKDASATAIYGSRGANGVVLITTKRGKAGQSAVEFETFYSVSRITKMFDLVNASESLRAKNEQLVNLGRPERYGTDPAYGPRKPDDYLPGTDWQREIYRDAPTQNYQLTASGGNEKLRYLVSGNYFNQDGIIITNKFKRYSTRMNLDAQLSDRVKLGTTFTLTRSDNNLVSEVASNTTAGTSSNPVQSALGATPAMTVFNADGSYTLNFLGMSASANPVAVLRTSTNTLQSDRILGTLFGEFKLADGLMARVSVGGTSSIFGGTSSSRPKPCWPIPPTGTEASGIHRTPTC
mgnify:CR=1 FL=1